MSSNEQDPQTEEYEKQAKEREQKMQGIRVLEYGTIV